MARHLGAAIRQGSRWLPWRTTLLCVLALVLYATAGPAPAGLVFERGAIADGEVWRLVTGHWVHTDPGHAGWDIGGLALLGLLFEGRLGWRLPAVLALGTVTVSACIWWALPDLQVYCGLSGILNALFAAGLAHLCYERPDPLVLLAGLAAAAKTGFEVATGSALLTDTAWPAVPAAHAAGLAAGVLWAWTQVWTWPLRRARRPSASPGLFATRRSTRSRPVCS